MSGLPILAYHAIDDHGDAIATPLPHFLATMAALHEAGYHCVDLQDWIDAGRPAVARGFALTFDDGLKSILRLTGVLQQYRFVPTIFLTTGRMGRDNGWSSQPASITRREVLSWRDAADLATLGFKFAAHSITHRRLDRLDNVALEQELRRPKIEILDQLGMRCDLLAYPYGRHDERVREAARTHFAAGFGTRLAYASPREDLHQISRLDAHVVRTAKGVDRLISGRLGPWLRARRLTRAVRGI